MYRNSYGVSWGMGNMDDMNDNRMNRVDDADRRRMLAFCLAGGAISSMPGAFAADSSADEGLHNSLLWAVAWKQTAAEYRALCYQAYYLARLQLDVALRGHKAGDRPLAIITDMDNTMLHVGSYWGYLINENKDFFDDAIKSPAIGEL